jgi:hypothetical protein
MVGFPTGIYNPVNYNLLVPGLESDQAGIEHTVADTVSWIDITESI